MILMPSAFAAEVEIASPTAPVPEGSAITFTVKESLQGSLFMDGCSPAELEQKVEGRWLTVPLKLCDAPRSASEFDTSLTFSLPTPPRGAGTYRAVVTWGQGCSPARSFVTAGCTTLGSVVSAPFVVSPGSK